LEDSQKEILNEMEQAIQISATLEKSDNKLWGAHVEVPAAIVKKLAQGSSRRVVCRLNDTVEYQCAMLPHGNGTFVISVNKGFRDKLELKFGDTVRMSLRKDKSEYGLPLAEEFRELLKQDKDGGKFFHALTKGKQRTLLYIVGKGKHSDQRLARALTIVNHLKSHNGKIDYKKLSEALRPTPAVQRLR
jgi:hypothetical protein